MANVDSKKLVLLLIVFAVLFTANLGGYGLWPPDEPRFGQVAREMMQSGDYIVPHINGQPYKEKPPLLFWAITAVSAPIGDVTEFSARVPSVIAALLILLFTYLLAARLFDSRTALWAVVILGTTNRFWWQARGAQTDMLLAAAMTGALLSFWLWHTQRRTRWLVLFYAAIAVGLYAKGPPALVFPLLLIVSFYWKQKHDRIQLHWITGYLVAVAAILCWWIPAQYLASADSAAAAEAEIGSSLYRQIVGRLFLGVSHAQWPWYYFLTVPVDLLPWALFLPWSIWYVWRKRRDSEAMRLLLAWSVPAFIFFSISIGKRGIYLLPIFPALAILLAFSILPLMDGNRLRWRRWIGYAWAATLLTLAAAPIVLLATEHADKWSDAFYLFSGALVIMAVWALIECVRTEAQRLHATIAWNFIALLFFAAFVLFPLIDPYKSAEDACEPLRELAMEDVSFDLYSVAFSREEYVFYSRRFHEAILVDVLPMETGDGTDPETLIREQLELRDAIRDAAAAVEVTSTANITATELSALREAILIAESELEIPESHRQAFEQALEKVIDDFAAAFETDRPAFFFVQVEDWKWLLPFRPEMRNYPVVKDQDVGSREMLLIANAAGADLLRARDYPLFQDLKPVD